MTIVQTRLGSSQAVSVKSQPTGNIAATTVQDAIEELEAEKQGIDTELTDIAALTPTDGLFIVGNGSDFVGESGNTARTSLGVGTGDSPTLTALSLSTQLNLTPISAPAHTEGRVFYDDDAKTLVYYNEEADVSMNLGREEWIRVYNDSGSAITNGSIVYVSGYDATNDLPEISLADATDPNASRIAGVATHDIENGTVGYITAFGRVNDLDTSGLTAGNVLWLDPSTPGGFTTTRPTAPNFAVVIGIVVKVDMSTGSILVGSAADSGGIESVTSEVFNGTVIEDIDVDVSSNGTTITLTVEANGGGDLTLVFNSLPVAFDAMPAASVTLTAGSDTSPQINYVYILESNNTLTASTSGFPAAQHVPIATVLCQSAASLQNDKAMKVHVWNDHLAGSDSQGHLSHLNRWIRAQNATWASGVAVTPTAGAGQLDIATSAGVILQLHDHAYPAFDTSGGDVIYVVNDPDAAYTQVASLTQADGIDKDANGNTLGTGSTDFYNLVLWGVVSEDADDCKLMCNLPTAAYANDTGSQASNDDAQTAVYAIPEEFKGTGFLIARLTISESGGTYAVENSVDLRGQQPGLQTGGGAFGGNEFADNVFRVQDDGDTTKEIALDASGITTGTTRTFTAPDASGTWALSETLASTANGDGASLVGIEDSGGIITATTVEGALAEIQTDLNAAEADIDAIEADYLTASDITNMLETTDIGSTVQGFDADTLKADTADVLTAGFAHTDYNAGTQSSGTFTPDESNGNIQYAVNGGAHTLAPPTNSGTIILQYTNDSSAGAITTSGFTVVTGDSFTTTDGDDFICYISKVNGFSQLHVVDVS